MKGVTILVALLAVLASARVAAHGDEVHDHAEPAAPVPAMAAGEAPRRLADGSLFVPKSAQRAWGIRTQLAAAGTHAATVELNGTVIPDPDTAGRVQATQVGSVLPGPKGMPVPGRAVRKGEVLAWLRSAATAVDRGNQQAQLADIEVQLQLAKQRVQRLERLAGSAGAVSAETLDVARADVVSLEQQRGHVSDSVNRSDALVSPVSGVISASHVVAGQVVDAKDTLFEIVDPSRLWVEALAYDARIAVSVQAASARAGDVPLALAFVGGGRQLRAQALPLLFRITTKNAPVAVGQPVAVLVATRETVRGVKVSRAALGAGATASTLWVHAGAERFVPRRVTVRPLDAASVVVTGGLVDGERVVEQGASLLGQVR